MPNAGARASKFLPYLNSAMKEFGIDTPIRAAHFLAQVAEESAELRYTAEIASGAAYEGRRDLGNTHTGDGRRFKGRGLIQLTGRSNYEAYRDFCGFDVINKPYLLEQPRGATRSAAWFWSEHGLNRYADADNIEKITRIINGGTNGLAQRRKYLARAKKALGL